MRVFGNVRAEGFRHEAVRYLRQSLVDQTSAYSDEELLQIAALAMERTSLHGIERKIDLFRWLHLMLALGFEFDRDPSYPWVSEVLESPAVDPDAIMPWLTMRAVQHLS